MTFLSGTGYMENRCNKKIAAGFSGNWTMRGHTSGVSGPSSSRTPGSQGSCVRQRALPENRGGPLSCSSHQDLIETSLQTERTSQHRATNWAQPFTKQPLSNTIFLHHRVGRFWDLDILRFCHLKMLLLQHWWSPVSRVRLQSGRSASPHTAYPQG